jgi:3-dehydroquinate dehydratase II
MKFLVVHGPNLNLLGRRETSVYGTASLADVDELIRATASELGAEVTIHQSAREGEIIELLHAGIDDVDGALVNPGAYAATSRAIADAIRSVDYPVVEVHLSNIHAREPWRAHSVTAEASVAIVSGFGPGSYVAALRALVHKVRE